MAVCAVYGNRVRCVVLFAVHRLLQRGLSCMCLSASALTRTMLIVFSDQIALKPPPISPNFAKPSPNHPPGDPRPSPNILSQPSRPIKQTVSIIHSCRYGLSLLCDVIFCVRLWPVVLTMVFFAEKKLMLLHICCLWRFFLGSCMCLFVFALACTLLIFSAIKLYTSIPQSLLKHPQT